MSKKPIYEFSNEKKLTIDKIEIAYHQEGEGEVIILLHDWPQTSYMWRKIIPILSKNFKVIALDLPGLGIEKLHLIGHDIGAWVATSYSLHFKIFKQPSYYRCRNSRLDTR